MLLHSSSTLKSIEAIALEVIEGKWGTGNDRKKKLQAAGYNYSEVQNRVNKEFEYNTPKKKYIFLPSNNHTWGGGYDLNVLPVAKNINKLFYLHLNLED